MRTAMPQLCGAPLGCWGSLRVYDSARLLKVSPQELPLQHYACSRSLCTGYRLLEDYGNLRPGDTIIQNAADLPTGQALIQLCKMLKIRTINLVPDDASFTRTKELLMGLGATIVLKDNTNVVTFLKELGSEMPAPLRLASLRPEHLAQLERGGAERRCEALDQLDEARPCNGGAQLRRDPLAQKLDRRLAQAPLGGFELEHLEQLLREGRTS